MILSSISANSCRFWVFSQLVALASYALQIFSWIPQEWLHLSFPKFRILNIVLFFSLAVAAPKPTRFSGFWCSKGRSSWMLQIEVCYPYYPIISLLVGIEGGVKVDTKHEKVCQPTVRIRNESIGFLVCQLQSKS